MEQKKTTIPEWIEEMQKWQKENPNERAVLCIATYNGSASGALLGKNLPLVGALLTVMAENSSWVDICKGALTAKENPIAAL